LTAPPDPTRVFGLNLREELRAPTCADDAERDAQVLESLKTQTRSAARHGGVNCQLAPTAMKGNARLFAQRLANVTVDPIPSGVDFTLVALPAFRCPAWVLAAGACVLGVTTKQGKIVGVSYFVGGEARHEEIENGLQQKYGVEAKSLSPSACQDPKLGVKKAATRVWETAGVRVSYFPLGGLSCAQGRVLVETDEMRALFKQPTGEKP
jgi:hypothetical protein